MTRNHGNAGKKQLIEKTVNVSIFQNLRLDKSQNLFQPALTETICENMR